MTAPPQRKTSAAGRASTPPLEGGPVGARSEPPVPARSSEARAFRRMAGVAAGLAMAIGATYAFAPFAALRPWAPGSGYVPFWNIVGREFMSQGRALSAEADRVAALRRRTEPPPSPLRRTEKPEPIASDVFPMYAPERRVARPDYGIEPPEALDHYFRKLTLVDLGVKHAIARAGHWGDSVLGVDGITSGIRRRLQAHFGDAGHGFHLMDQYNPSYRHQGVRFEPGGGWSRCLVVFECDKVHHRYGYGGLVVRSAGGARATWSTTKAGFGSVASRFELWYAEQPGGGNFEIIVDHRDTVVVRTRGPRLRDAWRTIEVAPGGHTFTVRAAGGGEVRAYGVVLENDGPGVVWDGLALIGGSTRGLATQDVDHIESQTRRRHLDLYVFMFGGNDMERGYVDLRQSMQPYYDEYGNVLRHFRAGNPDASCLVMSVTDHGRRAPDGRIVSRKFARTLSAAQREVARRNGCGFFDTYAATGGEGTVARWYAATPRLISPDLGHPNSLGHEVIAGLLFDALLFGYEQYRDRMAGQPLPELAHGADASGVSDRPAGATGD